MNSTSGTIHTDASKYAYTGILTQHSNGTDLPITYVSRLFHGSQLNWATLTKEAYAIYMSVKKLSFYTDTAKITVKSDHLPLKKFLEKNTLNSKVNNWAVELESQNIIFEYIPGIWNTLADTLSRLIEMDENIKLQPEDEGKEFGYFPFKELPPVTMQVVEEVIKCEIGNINIQHEDPVQINTQITLPMKDEKLVKLQESDPHIKQLRIQWKNNNKDKNAYIMENNILRRKIIDNGLLYTPIVVPDILKDCLLILAHDKSGHNSFRRTYASLKNRFHWKGMKKSVHQHCTNCQVCAKHNIKIQPEKLKIGDNMLIRDHTLKAFQPKYKDFCIIGFLGKNQIEVKDNHGHTTKVHLRDVKKIMTEKICQLYEEQTGKTREGRKAVPNSKMPDLGWDIAETQLQKENKTEEIQELSETNTPQVAVPLQAMIAIAILLATILEHPKSYIQEIPEIARRTAQAVTSMITKISCNNNIQRIRKIHKTAVLAVTIVTDMTDRINCKNQYQPTNRNT